MPVLKTQLKKWFCNSSPCQPASTLFPSYPWGLVAEDSSLFILDRLHGPSEAIQRIYGQNQDWKNMCKVGMATNDLKSKIQIGTVSKSETIEWHFWYTLHCPSVSVWLTGALGSTNIRGVQSNYESDKKVYPTNTSGKTIHVFKKLKYFIMKMQLKWF